MLNALRRFVWSAAALALTAPAWAADAPPKAAPEATPAGYCKATGGTAERMLPWANTNADPALWAPYGGPTGVCAYTAADGSMMALFNQTLVSPLPTMAALAYYAKVPWDGKGFGNPAWLYCKQLGGTQQIGSMGSGSGWAARRGDRVFSLCVFADRSAIDDWGLFYHSNDIIRGVDLATVLRFPNPYRAQGAKAQ